MMSYDRDVLVTCQSCGCDVPKRSACGVGSGYLMTWTCCDCIKRGAMDRVFAPIGAAISRVIESAGAARDGGEHE